MGGGPREGIVAQVWMPPGISMLHRIRGRHYSFKTYRTSVLILTFIAYACFHAARKPPSIVKGVLHPDDNDVMPVAPPVSTLGVTHGSPTMAEAPLGAPVQSQLASGNQSASDLNARAKSLLNVSKDLTGGLSGGWAPFSGKLGKGLLGEMDVAFLSCYAVGMYFAGHLGDRVDLRLFLTMGMVGSGLFVCLFGMAYFWDVHTLSYFLLFQMLGGLFQSIGWPSVVSIMANWFGKKRRGLILGIWNAHTSVGNITGSLLASLALTWGWGWAFLLPGFIIVLGGLLLYLFLIPEPELVGLKVPTESADLAADSQETISESLLAESVEKTPAGSLLTPEDNHSEAGSSSGSGSPARAGLGFPVADFSLTPGAPLVNALPLLEDLPAGVKGKNESTAIAAALDESAKLLDATAPSNDVAEAEQAVGFLEAWRIPGVASFAICLFFAKLVAYTFLYWLPFYIGHTEIGGSYMSNAMAGVTSTVFDIAGIFGGILAGHLSDHYSAQATVASGFMALAIPCMALYFLYGHLSFAFNIGLLALVGFLVNGPYALITCAVSADLGQHSSLKGNARALATVTAIIDGTGSVGAAIGPFLTGFMSEIGGQAGWAAVFLMLMLASLAAVLCLLRLVRRELDEWRHSWQRVSANEEAGRHLVRNSQDTLERETGDDKV